ncbi:MAG: GTP cyclohydrolase I FolE [bacterium]|nr:GTP cyclohydrolase I FolE [bacterium]
MSGSIIKKLYITKIPELDKFENTIKKIIEKIGDNPKREGLKKTPMRFLKALTQLTWGYSVDIDKLINKAIFKETYSEMIVVKKIPFYSLCEHHILPFFGDCSIGYIPDGYIIGLSKIPRIVEAFSRRLQLQERLTQEIANIIFEKIKPLGVGVVMRARHLCMEMRGVEKPNSEMVTSEMLGTFRTDPRTRQEFLNIIQ